MSIFTLKVVSADGTVLGYKLLKMQKIKLVILLVFFVSVTYIYWSKFMLYGITTWVLFNMFLLLIFFVANLYKFLKEKKIISKSKKVEATFKSYESVYSWATGWGSKTYTPVFETKDVKRVESSLTFSKKRFVEKSSYIIFITNTGCLPIDGSNWKIFD